MWTKKQLVEAAYGEIGIAAYTYDLSPEEKQAALQQMDAMMGSWASLDINVGYQFGLSPEDTDLDRDSGVALFAVQAVYKNLAVAIAPMKGKQLSQATKANAKAAYDAMLVTVAKSQVSQQQFRSGTPRGAGNRVWRTSPQPFLGPVDDAPLTNSSDGGLVFNDGP